MESTETPSNGFNGRQQIIPLVSVNSTKVLDKNDATSLTKVQPIKIVIPSSNASYKPPEVISSSKMIVSPVNLSEQPTVTVKLGANQLNVRMVTNASLIQNSVISPSENGVLEREESTSDNSIDTKSTDISPSSSMGTRRDDSPAKPSREQKQLQESINSSLVLSQMIMGSSTVRKSKGRKKKSQSPKEPQDTSSLDAQKLSRSKSMEVLSLMSNRRDSRRSVVGNRSMSPVDQDSDAPKRLNMRSSNAEFAQKQKSFMKEIIKTQESADEGEHSDEAETEDSKSTASKSIVVLDDLPQPPKKGWSHYCFRCFQSGELECCSNAKCRRSYHLRCMSKQQQPVTSNDKKWSCPECHETETAETMYKGKPKFEKDFVSTLLTFVYNRMAQTKNSNLLTATNEELVSADNENYIVYPMNLDILQTNIKMKKYKSVEAFHSDVKWLLYNCSVYPEKRRYLPNAKSLLKVCRQEILEIETCFECYFKANTDTEWFTDVCSSPHILLWAKLRGFPYWPAKAMSVNGTTGQVNVRFFGAHDRAWIYVKDCYLYSKEDPNGTNPKKQNDIAECIKEVNTHIQKLAETFSGFKHAALRSPYDPAREQEQLRQLLPNIDRYNRTTDVNKLVEALLSGHKPKLTLKIIRTADNTPNKINIKRSADSWMIQDSMMKRQKTSSVDENDQEKQKGTLMRSLHLERRDSSQVQSPASRESDKMVKEGTPRSEDGGSERTKKLVKRRKTMHVENWNNNDSPVPQKRRSQRIKSTVEKALEKEQNKEKVPDSTPTKQKSTPAVLMTEPPPLIPFETTQIKPDPDSEEDSQSSAQSTPRANVTVTKIPSNVTHPTNASLTRIKVKNMNQLTNNREQLRTLFSNYKQPTQMGTNVAPVPHPIQMNGPKKQQTPQQQQQRPGPGSKKLSNMVYIPGVERNGPQLDTSLNLSNSTSSTSNDSNSDPPIHALSGFITPTFAAAITDTIVRAPPKLAKSPKGSLSALRGESNHAFNSEAGPTSRLLSDNAHRIADFFRSVLIDSISDLSVNESLEAKNRRLELEIEQLKQRHTKEIAELKYNSDLILSEFKKSQEKREAQLIEEITRKCEIDRIRAINETKQKSWCTLCKREAMYHCCGGVWYCDYRCQKNDWSEHMRHCLNGKKQDNTTGEQMRTQHAPAVGITPQQHRSLLLQQNQKGQQIPAPVIRQQQQLMMQKSAQMGLISQRSTTGPKIISVRGMVK